MTSIHCISRADILPFEVSDAARSEEEIKEAEAAGELKARVSQDVRLNGRYIDLRTAANQAIFKVQSGVCQVSCRLLTKSSFADSMLSRELSKCLLTCLFSLESYRNLQLSFQLCF